MTASLATSGYGTILKRGDGGTKASLTTDSGTAAKKIVWEARATGTGGNSISVDLDGSGTHTSTTVSVVSNAITVLLKSSSGTPSALASEVVAAIRASVAASALVKVTLGGDGTGIVSDAGPTSLAGGVAEAFSAVAEVNNISGPSEALETIDVTHLTSPSARREFIASLLDSGECSFDLNFLPSDANQSGVRNDLSNRVRRRWQIVYTDESLTTAEFDAFVTSWEPSAQVDDKLGVSAGLKVTGPVTMTATA